MAKAVDRNTLTFADAAHPCSNATGEVPVNSLKSSVSKCESPSTTTTIGFLTRNPIGYSTDDQLLYSYCSGKSLKRLDPTGNVAYTIDDGNPSALPADAKVECGTFLIDFLRNPQTNGWPEVAVDELSQSPNIFCGDCYSDSKIAAPSYSWGETICNICLDDTNGKRLPEEWSSWLLHELTHCNKDYPCGKTNTPGPPTSVPPQKIPKPVWTGKDHCKTCLDTERPVYRQQCKWLFPNDPKKQLDCVEFGLCLSCKDHPCNSYNQWYKSCKTTSMPEISPGVPSSGGYPPSER